METKKRMTAWTILPEPKPAWEQFKRLLAEADDNPAKAHDIFVQRLRIKALRTCNFEAPPRMVNEFRIFTECAPAEMLTDWAEWTRT